MKEASTPRIFADIEAEQAVLACMLLNLGALNRAIGSLDASYFVSDRNRLIFEAMFALNKAGELVDRLPIKRWLETHGKLNDAGGVAYLAELTSALPIVEDFGAYATILRECLERRALDSLAKGLKSDALNPDRDPSDALVAVQRAAADFSTRIAGPDPIAELVDRREKWLTPGNAIEWPWPGVQKVLGDPEGGRLVVVAALTNVGKTFLTLDFANECARRDEPAHVVGLEMTAPELLRRVCVWETGRDPKELNQQSNYYMPAKLFADWTDFRRTVPLTFSGEAQLGKLLNGLNRERMRGRAKVVVVDFVQLVRTRPGAGIQERVSETIYGLKEWARSADSFVVAVSQFNRVGAKSGEPSIHDLEGAGALEQAANAIAFLNRPADRPIVGGYPVTLKNEKHREDVAGLEAALWWNHTRRRFDTEKGEKRWTELQLG